MREAAAPYILLSCSTKPEGLKVKNLITRYPSEHSLANPVGVSTERRCANSARMDLCGQVAYYSAAKLVPPIPDRR